MKTFTVNSAFYVGGYPAQIEGPEVNMPFVVVDLKSYQDLKEQLDFEIERKEKYLNDLFKLSERYQKLSERYQKLLDEKAETLINKINAK